MNSFIESLIKFIVAGCISYILYSFWQQDFNIFNWEEIARKWYVGLGIIHFAWIIIFEE